MTMKASRPPLSERACDQRGMALIIALMATSLLMALGVALVLTTMTEGKISANHRDGAEALYAADAAVERAIQDLLLVSDWDAVLAGSVTSSFMDGATTGERTLPGGRTMDVGQATNMVRCGKLTACGDADLNAITDERPWGLNNPRWQLYAAGPITDLLPTVSINSQMYVMVWIADDPAESDNDPLKDGLAKIGCVANDPTCVNLGKGVIAMLAHAYGPGGVQRIVETTLARTDTTEMERGYVGQHGQGEKNRRARQAPVQRPGQTLTRSELDVTAGGFATP
jgi:hypothetical protein